MASQWKWERRDRISRNKALEHSKKNTKTEPIGKKDEILVKGYLNGNQEEVFELTISSKRFTGHPKEYDEIKKKCIKKYDCKINLLEISTK